MVKTKKCCTCKDDLPISDFHKRPDTPDGLYGGCIKCHREVSKRNYRKYRDKYIALTAKRNAGYKMLSQEFIYQYLKSHPCIDCGESHPVKLQFDHVRGKKEGTICSMVNVASTKTLERIKKEISKCEVRCANCHAMKTSIEFNWQILQLYKNDLAR